MLTGCGNGESNTGHGSTAVLPSEVPGAFDPCRDIPDSVLLSLHIDPGSRRSIPDQVNGGGYDDQVERVRGCEFAINGSAIGGGPTQISIEATNITIDYFRKSRSKDEATQEISADGRTSIVAGPFLGGQCHGLVGIVGGGILLSTVDRDAKSCDTVAKAVQAIAPLLPKGS
ncbi:DUF3558 family protein [Nocardia sp. NPDC004722]